MIDPSWAILTVNILVMKGILVFFCIFMFVFGALFLFAPNVIEKMNAWSNRVIFGPIDRLPSNAPLGILLLILGAVITVILFSF